MKKYGVIIHPEDVSELLRMNNDERGKVVGNMLRTFSGEQIEKFDDRYLDFVSTTLCGRVLRDKELSETKSRVGKLGGAPEGNQNAKTTKEQPKNKQKTTKGQAKTTPNTNTNTNTNNIKDIYGEAKNVYLTAEEYQKIKDKGLTELIEELSLYMASKKKTYADHYMTILAWGRRREKENKVEPLSGANAKNQFNRFTQRTDYDFAALEKKLIKN